MCVVKVGGCPAVLSLLVSDCQLSTERRFATHDNTTYLQWSGLSVAADSSHFARVAQVGGG